MYDKKACSSTGLFDLFLPASIILGAFILGIARFSNFRFRGTASGSSLYRRHFYRFCGVARDLGLQYLKNCESDEFDSELKITNEKRRLSYY